MNYIIVAIFSYLIGNISASYLIGKLKFNEDIRTKGSGNAGTTNIFRNYGLSFALITLSSDFFKGFLAVYLSSFFVEQTSATYIAGIFTVVGHIWPVFMRFKGGKGVATSAGVLVYHIPHFIFILIILFFIINYIGKIMSITSLLLTISSMIYVGIIHGTRSGLFIMVTINGILIFYSHRENIKRLLNGSENKLNIKKDK